MRSLGVSFRRQAYPGLLSLRATFVVCMTWYMALNHAKLMELAMNSIGKKSALDSAVGAMHAAVRFGIMFGWGLPQGLQSCYYLSCKTETRNCNNSRRP